VSVSECGYVCVFVVGVCVRDVCSFCACERCVVGAGVRVQLCARVTCAYMPQGVPLCSSVCSCVQSPHTGRARGWAGCSLYLAAAAC